MSTDQNIDVGWFGNNVVGSLENAIEIGGDYDAYCDTDDLTTGYASVCAGALKDLGGREMGESFCVGNSISDNINVHVEVSIRQLSFYCCAYILSGYGGQHVRYNCRGLQ